MVSLNLFKNTFIKIVILHISDSNTETGLDIYAKILAGLSETVEDFLKFYLFFVFPFLHFLHMGTTFYFSQRDGTPIHLFQEEQERAARMRIAVLMASVCSKTMILW